MNPFKTLILLLTALGLGVPAGWAQPAQQLNKAAHAGSRASANSANSAGHSLAATGQLASGVVAVPMLIGGELAVSAGASASGVGKALMDSANAPIGKPLPLAQETVSIVPPDQALQKPATTPR